MLQYNILHCFIKLQKAGDNNTQPSLQDIGSLSCTASTSRWTWLRRSTWPTQQVPSFLAGFSSTNNIKTESHTDFKGQWPTPRKLAAHLILSVSLLAHFLLKRFEVTARTASCCYLRALTQCVLIIKHATLHVPSSVLVTLSKTTG